MWRRRCTKTTTSSTLAGTGTRLPQSVSRMAYHETREITTTAAAAVRNTLFTPVPLTTYLRPGRQPLHTCCWPTHFSTKPTAAPSFPSSSARNDTSAVPSAAWDSSSSHPAQRRRSFRTDCPPTPMKVETASAGMEILAVRRSATFFIAARGVA